MAQKKHSKLNRQDKASFFGKLLRGLNGYFYDIKIMAFPPRKEKKTKTLSLQKYNNTIFYVCCFSVPFLFFLLNTVVINANALLLSFQEISVNGVVSFAGFKNFSAVINDFIVREYLLETLLRSVKVYFILMLVTNVLPSIFTYYIYKKLPGFKFFKVVMFLPSIISGITTITIYKALTERLVPEISYLLTGARIEGLLSNTDTTFFAVFFYSIWLSFGSGMLIQLAAMNTVNESVTESAHIEGVGFFKEFWHIVLPASYQILCLHLITGVATVFTNDLGLFAFYGLGADAKVYTIGYYFTIKTLAAKNYDYPYYSAWGLITSSIAIPVTFLLRHFIYKYGPSED